MSNYPNPDFPMTVTVEDDGRSITFDWDQDHYITSVFNDWTEDDFMAAIMKACRDTLGDEEFERIQNEGKTDSD